MFLKATKLLRGLALKKLEAIFCKAMYRMAVLILHHNVDYDQLRASMQHGRPLGRYRVLTV